MNQALSYMQTQISTLGSSLPTLSTLCKYQMGDSETTDRRCVQAKLCKKTQTTARNAMAGGYINRKSEYLNKGGDRWKVQDTHQ